MMYMDEEFLESNDLDWFSSYEDGSIAHFATGGCCLVPEKIRESIDNYGVIYDYFYSLNVLSEIEIIEENLPKFANETQRTRYLQSFIEISSKGIFSYDYRIGEGYKLISKPKNGLQYGMLPDFVKQILYILPCDILPKAKLITSII
ncbi:hypothetical protein ACBQ20_17855 [Proteus vulgaris]|uniref:hypothetical protein n=1 Tax=Proteus vulgaris TaxID=585 RepID=UPI003526AE45